MLWTITNQIKLKMLWSSLLPVRDQSARVSGLLIIVSTILLGLRMSGFRHLGVQRSPPILSVSRLVKELTLWCSKPNTNKVVDKWPSSNTTDLNFTTLNAESKSSGKSKFCPGLITSLWWSCMKRSNRESMYTWSWSTVKVNHFTPASKHSQGESSLKKKSNK